MRLLFLCTMVLVALSVQAEQESEVSLQRGAREAEAHPNSLMKKLKKVKNQKKKGRKNKKNQGNKKKTKKGNKNRKNQGNKSQKTKGNKRRNRGRKQPPQGRAAIKGNNCEYIFLADITSNSGCTTGNKFVIKGATGVRKQFLILNSKTTLAFVTKGAKFTACTTFTDITTTVTCKEVTGLASVDLGSSGSAAATTEATAGATTAAAGATTLAPVDMTAGATTLAPVDMTATSGATTAAAGATTAAAGATTAAGAVTTASPSTTNSSRVVFPLKTSAVSAYTKFTEVFGVAVFGAASISEAKFQHVASVLAEWLDNDEDGCVDNALVLTKLLASPKAATLALADGAEVDSDGLQAAGYALSAYTENMELLPQNSGPAATDVKADATLEEVLHMVTDAGYAKAYPAIFAVEGTSKLTEAMDVARGGKFTSIPSSYPASAWYTYNDATCGYQCQATEYIYWGMSAYVGSIVGRKNSIAAEWKLSTRAELLAKDTLLSAIIQDTATYTMPSVSPTGVYAAPRTCKNGGAAHGGN